MSLRGDPGRFADRRMHHRTERSLIAAHARALVVPLARRDRARRRRGRGLEPLIRVWFSEHAVARADDAALSDAVDTIFEGRDGSKLNPMGVPQAAGHGLNGAP
jgi:hypothetical protein